MRKLMRSLALVVCGAAVGAVCAGAYSITYAAQPRIPTVAFKEIPMGSIPRAWGELVGVTSVNQQSVILIFCDDKPDKGKLRRVQWNPNGIAEVVAVIERGN
ncbi:MAG TPA: hypothetical protein DCM87_17465 [Planctomycetes bacterium]|nr:hypothetical protein [Planctomycetota bacterium]